MRIGNAAESKIFRNRQKKFMNKSFVKQYILWYNNYYKLTNRKRENL